MLRRVIRTTLLLLLSSACGAATSLGACTGDKPGPALVDADDTSTPADVQVDGTTAPDATSTPDGTVSDTTPADTRPGTSDVSGIWVEDANGVGVGLLVRRGSDDATASRAIYDFVTVFEPVSGLFFEVTMTDAVVRYPPNTFFDGYSCDAPVGIGIGPCADCRSAWNLGFRHADKWYKMRGGATFETRSPGSVLKGGISSECVAHGTASAKVFVVDRVELNAPPVTYAAPLRFVAR